MGFGTPRIRTKRVRDPLDTLRQRFGTQRHPTGRVWDTTDTLQVGFGTPPRPTRPGFRARSPAGGLRRLPPALCSAPLGCVAVKTLQIPPETLQVKKEEETLPSTHDHSFQHSLDPYISAPGSALQMLNPYSLFRNPSQEARQLWRAALAPLPHQGGSSQC